MEDFIDFVVEAIIEVVGGIVETVIDSLKAKKAEKRRNKQKTEYAGNKIDLRKIDGKIIK